MGKSNLDYFFQSSGLCREIGEERNSWKVILGIQIYICKKMGETTLFAEDKYRAEMGRLKTGGGSGKD